MDGHRFDRVVKSLAAGAGRRQLVKGAAAGLVAGAAAWLGRGSVDAARCVRYGKTCHRNKPCCSGFCLDDGTCGCGAHVDCDDGGACTLDLCGPTSHACHHLPIANPCQECRHDHQCGDGGTCCHGRCCRDGAACRVNEHGLPICCPTCENGQACCDTIAFEESNGEIGYMIHTTGCVGEGQFEGLPSFCCAGAGGGYVQDEDGSISARCESPVGGVF